MKTIPFMQKPSEPVPITLADWKPLCNAELEVRLKLDFELPLTDDLIELMHPSVQAASQTLAQLENGIPECKISLDFNEVLDIFTKSNDKAPYISLPPGRIHGLVVFRSVASTADAKQRFLYFTTTVRMATDADTEKLVMWALRNIRRTVWINALETQLTLEDQPSE